MPIKDDIEAGVALAMRERDRRRSRNAIFTVVGLALFAVLLVWLRMKLDDDSQGRALEESRERTRLRPSAEEELRQKIAREERDIEAQKRNSGK